MEILTQLLLLPQAFALFNEQVTGFAAPTGLCGTYATGIWTSASLQPHTLLTGALAGAPGLQ